MNILFDLPLELVDYIDSFLARKPEPPTWPFEKREVKTHELSGSGLRTLQAYQAEHAQYLRALQRYKNGFRSRRAVVIRLLEICKQNNLVPFVLEETPEADPSPPPLPESPLASFRALERQRQLKREQEKSL